MWDGGLQWPKRRVFWFCLDAYTTLSPGNGNTLLLKQYLGMVNHVQKTDQYWCSLRISLLMWGRGRALDKWLMVTYPRIFWRCILYLDRLWCMHLYDSFNYVFWCKSHTFLECILIKKNRVWKTQEGFSKRHVMDSQGTAWRYRLSLMVCCSSWSGEDFWKRWLRYCFRSLVSLLPVIVNTNVSKQLK